MSDISREKILYLMWKNRSALVNADIHSQAIIAVDLYYTKLKAAIKSGRMDADPWIPVSTPPECCVWEYYENDDVWITDCENAWQFVDGTPKENGSKYCMYCGKPIATTPVEE